MCIRNALSVDQRVDGADAAGYIFKSVYQRHCSLLVWGCDVSSRKTKRLQPHNCISQILPSNIESKVCHVQTELRESSVLHSGGPGGRNRPPKQADCPGSRTYHTPPGCHHTTVSVLLIAWQAIIRVPVVLLLNIGQRSPSDCGQIATTTLPRS